jgi:ribosomal protein L30
MSTSIPTITRFPLVAVTLLRSWAGQPKPIHGVLRALQLTHRHKTVYHKNIPEIRGQLKKVSFKQINQSSIYHLLTVF